MLSKECHAHHPPPTAYRPSSVCVVESRQGNTKAIKFQLGKPFKKLIDKPSPWVFRHPPTHHPSPITRTHHPADPPPYLFLAAFPAICTFSTWKLIFDNLLRNLTQKFNKSGRTTCTTNHIQRPSPTSAGKWVAFRATVKPNNLPELRQWALKFLYTWTDATRRNWNWGRAFPKNCVKPDEKLLGSTENSGAHRHICIMWGMWSYLPFFPLRFYLWLQQTWRDGPIFAFFNYIQCHLILAINVNRFRVSGFWIQDFRTPVSRQQLRLRRHCVQTVW